MGIIAVYGGGFKPPTIGHVEVLLTALQENPEIDEVRVYVGNKTRNGITQEDSVKIWNIYSKYLPSNVKILSSSKAPIRLVYNTAKDNPDTEVYWIIGVRGNNEDDILDLQNRTKSMSKYPNLKLKPITTKGNISQISGTDARSLVKTSQSSFNKYLPNFLNDVERNEVYQILVNVVTEGMFAEGSYTNIETKEISSKSPIDLKLEIAKLTKHMLSIGMNILPLPKLIFKQDYENSQDFLGKTAYYDPNTPSIILYTTGRHAKDIVRSFSHEMIHHIQNLEDRLGNIQTTNTQEDDNLNNIEAEANLKGTMTFRNWTDSLNERKIKDPFGLNAYARELAMGLEEDIDEIPLTPEGGDVSSQKNINMDYKIYCDMDGVLADFERGYKELTNIDPNGEDRPTGEAFWAPLVKAGVSFWASLKWMSDGEQLWDYIKPHNPELLSAPSRDKSSRIGKHVWVKHNIPGTRLILKYASQKSQLASPTSILIDDRQANIDQWVEAGGIGILHTNTTQTIKELKDLGL